MKTRLFLASPKLLAVAAGLGALAIAGCGGDDGLPDDAVAKVGDTVITKADYNKSHRLITLSPFLKGESDEVFKRKTMEALIVSEWVEQKAAAEDLTVSDDQVGRVFKARKNSFPNEKAFRRFLKDAGLTEEDLRHQFRVELLQKKLEEKISRNAPKASPTEIESYYEQHKKRFTEPESHYFIFVVTKSKARAEQALQALEGGQRWQAVLRRYSSDPEHSRARAEKGPKLAEGRESLERAVYRTRVGEIEGPVKTSVGWYVFEVTKVTPKARQPLEEARETIASQLNSQRAAAGVQKFRREYRSKTVCAKDYMAPQCSNGPKEKTT
ncbi:MAG TPA: peptidyl-prolyl cis-trans isomerase [Thermoleophilaceae bacterium]|nr:peptidyl-prolyl cis-trans isomerase [Thermoleophilaceae bacterium]